MNIRFTPGSSYPPPFACLVLPAITRRGCLPSKCCLSRKKPVNAQGNASSIRWPCKGPYSTRVLLKKIQKSLHAFNGLEKTSRGLFFQNNTGMFRPGHFVLVWGVNDSHPPCQGVNQERMEWEKGGLTSEWDAIVYTRNRCSWEKIGLRMENGKVHM